MRPPACVWLPLAVWAGLSGCAEEGLPPIPEANSSPGSRLPAADPTGSAPVLRLQPDEEASLAVLAADPATAAHAVWTSDDEGVVDVDLARGVAIGREPGRARLRRSGSGGPAPSPEASAGSPATASGTVPVEVASRTVAALPAGALPAAFRGHSGPVWAVAVAAGRRALSGGVDRTVRLWQLDTGTHRRLTGHAGAVTAVGFTPDGTRVVSGSLDRTVRVWDAGTGLALRTLTGPSRPVRGVTVGPDGREVLAVDSGGAMHRWTLDEGRLVAADRVSTAPLWALALEPVGGRVATGASNGEVRVWRWPPVGPGTIASTAPSAVASLAFTGRGEQLHVGGLAVTTAFPGAAPAPLPASRGRLTRALAVSPDGLTLGRATGDGALEWWDLRLSARTHLAEGFPTAHALAFTGADAEVLAGHADGVLRLHTGVKR